MLKEFEDLQEFESAVGSPVGTSDWLTVTQDRIDMFAQATGDHQWIHVDPERAATGPFGSTIAHGYLTLSLLGSLAGQCYSIGKLTMGVNYGVNKVRFPSPVRVDSRVRASATLVSVAEVAMGSQFTIRFVIEIEGIEKPACIAEVIYVMA